MRLRSGLVHCSGRADAPDSAPQTAPTVAPAESVSHPPATAAAVAVLFYFFRTARNDDRILGSCALLLAGIAGNLTDRVRLGFVIDFIQLHAGQYHWPTFNVADASISFGALLLAYDLIFASRQTKEATDHRPLTSDL